MMPHLHHTLDRRRSIGLLLAQWLCMCVWLLPGLVWAQSCTGTFTITDNGGSANYSLGSTDALLINSGSFSGNITNLAYGARICVNPAAVFQPGSINNANGSLTNLGISVLPNLALGTGFDFSNLSGTTTFSSNPNFNGTTNFYNADGAWVNWNVSLQFGGNSTMVNDGTMSFAADFQNNLGTTVINNNRMGFSEGNLNPTGVFTNNGQVVGAGFININSTQQLSTTARFWPSTALTTTAQILKITAISWCRA